MYLKREREEPVREEGERGDPVPDEVQTMYLEREREETCTLRMGRGRPCT